MIARNAFLLGWTTGLLFVISAAAVRAAEPLTVRLAYKRSELSRSTLARARLAAAAILREAAIEPLWVDCVVVACNEPPGPADLVLRLISAPKGTRGSALGWSAVDL